MAIRLSSDLFGVPLPLLLGLLFISSLAAVQQPQNKCQQVVYDDHNNNHTVGLLEQGGGRTQVVHLASPSSIISSEEGGDEALVSLTTLLPPRPGKQRRVTHVQALLWTVGLFATLLRKLIFVVAASSSAPSLPGSRTTSHNDWAGPLFIFFLILYLLEASTCSTRRYLSNIRTPSQVKDYIVHQLQEAAPKVRWELECYHYENDDYYYCRRRSSRCPPSRHPYHGSSSDTKRVTHRASEVYEFQQWKDMTRLKEVLESLDYGSDDENNKAPYLKITLLKLVVFMDSVCYQNYLSQQARFIAREGNRDHYTDSWTTIEVDGCTPKLLAVRTGLGSKAHMRMPIFWIATLLGLTVPYRIWFSRNCDELDLVIAKQVSDDVVFPTTE